MADALQTYTILSIGDGLVSQFIHYCSIAAGILVTRSSEEANLGEYVGKQLVVYPKAMAISGVLLLLFSIFLSDTFWPFFTLAIACFACAYFLYKKSENEPEFSEIHEPQTGGASSPTTAEPLGAVPEGHTAENSLSPVEKAIEQEVFALEMGYGLLVLADKKRAGIFLIELLVQELILRKRWGCSCPQLVFVIASSWSRMNIGFC